MNIGIDVVVLTLNEERNLGACLESVRNIAGRIFVVDSGSSDRTAAIARDFHAEFVAHEFTSHAEQWGWALGNLTFSSNWVLAIDADQRVTPELAVSIEKLVENPGSTAGGYAARRQIFRGRWIRHGGYYPKYLLKLFRRDSVRVDGRDRVDHHFYIDGPAVILKGDLIEANLNEDEISTWIAKHNRYARLQAAEELERVGKTRKARFFGSPDERTERLKIWWRRMPLYLRPFLFFSYRYILRLGFLDGKEGFIFHFLQAFWYRLLVDINIDEIKKERQAAPAGATSIRTQ